MSPEILVLCGTAATIAFVHTLLGPDHYLPFVAMAKSRGWSVPKALQVTLVCGAGHIVGSVVLGLVGVWVGIQLHALEWIEGVRGDLAAWALVSLGLVYLAWGLRRAYRILAHPGFTDVAGDLIWQGSTPFEWTSRQLLELGMIEPGQWF